MNAIRFRAFVLLFLLGAAPVSAITQGLRYLPGAVLPWLAYALCLVAVLAGAIILSGFLSRPVRESLLAMHSLVRGGSTPHFKGWVPNELRRIQDGLQLVEASQRQQLLQLQQQLEEQTQLVAEAETAAVRSGSVLQAVVDQSRQGIAFMHASGHVALISSNLRDIFDLTEDYTQPGIEAKEWLSSVAAKMRNSADAARDWMSWQAGPSGQYEGDWELAATAEPHPIHVRSFDVRDDDQHIIGRLWLFRDTMEQRRMNSRLQESQKMESLGMLAGGIAHDFNNLLTAIRGNLALVDLEADNTKKQDKLNGATQAATRATDLVNRLLSFSRKQPGAKASADICQVIADVRTILRASLDPKVELKANSERLEWRAAVDPVHIEQVVLNLCINARDALPPTGGRIEITAETMQQKQQAEDPLSHRMRLPGDYVVIRVKDTGHGIPDELRSRIFEAFFTTKEAGKGTGLGLAMAHSIVSEAGGWMEFDSALGQGTEFRLYLPRCTRAPAGASTAATRPSTTSLKAGSAEGCILIVDDEASVRSIAVHMLKYLGYRVMEAGDGEEALEVIRQTTTPIDAIMMDVYMPKLSGRDTFKALRQSGCQTPVIVCSGFSVEQDEFANLSGGRNGPIEVIQKPYSMDRLATAIARAVESGHSALVA